MQPDGFIADSWVRRIDEPVLGLNLAFAWPLPSHLQQPYEALAARLQALDPGVYVYPYAHTHVTVATLVSFKEHADPGGAEQARILGMVPEIARRLTPILSGIAGFNIDVGAPLLVAEAAYLPIQNASGEVLRVRAALGATLHELCTPRIPQAIHSTVMRFRRAPAHPELFRSTFDAVAQGAGLGRARINELLITTETRPYMAAGSIAHRFRLSV
jgi:hypothetical protein